MTGERFWRRLFLRVHAGHADFERRVTMRFWLLNGWPCLCPLGHMKQRRLAACCTKSRKCQKARSLVLLWSESVATHRSGMAIAGHGHGPFITRIRLKWNHEHGSVLPSFWNVHRVHGHPQCPRRVTVGNLFMAWCQGLAHSPRQFKMLNCGIREEWHWLTGKECGFSLDGKGWVWRPRARKGSGLLIRDR